MIDNYGENAAIDMSLSDNTVIDTYQFRHGFTQNKDQTRRLAFHFINDPLPKFILGENGSVLSANALAEGLIQEGFLTSGPMGVLDYGTPDHNKSVRDILSNLCAGRAKCNRLIKRLPDDDWVVFEFARTDYLGNREILLTIKLGQSENDEALNAVSKAFNLTLTEMDVIKCMSLAYCPKEIGHEMGISVNTVRSHLRSIYSKIGVRGYNKALKLILKLLN